MRAMVLAAGYGTRLQPLTRELPKPLVPVGDRPLVAHVAERLAMAGVERLVVNTHHLAATFAKALRDSVSLPVDLIEEPEILGTAGGVAHASAWLGDGEAFVWNGDVLCEPDLAALLAKHRAAGADVTLLASPCRAGQGTLGMDAEGWLVRLRGERFGDERGGADFAAVQVVSRAVRARLPAHGCLVGDAYLPWLRQGSIQILVAPGVDRFIDVGTPASYLVANVAWLARRGLGHWVASTADVAPSVTLGTCVVGDGARVVGRGSVERVVVWPGARATAPLSDAVVLTSGQVVSIVGERA